MIPKFSIRQLLWAMVAIGVLSLCMSSAARGNRVAFGISVAVIGAIIPLAVYAVVHWASFAVASLLRLIDNRPVKTVNQEPAAVIGLPSDSGLAPESDQNATRDSDQGAKHA